MIAIHTPGGGGAVHPFPFHLRLSSHERLREQDSGPVPLDVSFQAHVASPTVLIAASALSEGLDAPQVAAAVAEGVRAALPSARVMQMPGPLAGPGFLEELVALSGGRIERISLLGLHGEVFPAQLGLIGPSSELTAVIAAEAADEDRFALYKRQDPTCASSRSTGQLIQAALDRGVRRIIVGCGEGGACDGGIGMASALGIRFLDEQRSEIAEAGGLLRLAAIDLTHRDRRIDEVSIEAVVDPSSDLLGPQGVARVHGPRTGASEPQVLRLERGLVRYAEVVRQSLKIDVPALPGGGACGGLAAGLVAFAGARLTSRRAFLRHAAALQACLAAADLVIVVEDRIDPAHAAGHVQPPSPAAAGDALDQVHAWVARQARAQGLPVIALYSNDLLEAGGEAGACGGVDAHAAFAPAAWGGGRPMTGTTARLRDVSRASLRHLLRGWDRAAEPT